MEDAQKEQTKEGQWFCVEIDGEKCYALFQNGCYWLPRNPIGLNESDLKCLGQMVQ